MISNATPWMYEHALYNGVATQSLRFDDGSSASLSGSMSSSPYTWTFSAWVKRATLSSLQIIGAARTSGVFASYISFQSGNTIEVVLGSGGTQTTTRLFRDTSAWYHVVVSCTGASGTAKLYINGVEEMSWSAGTTPYLFTNTLTYNASIGQYGGNVYYFDGYMADVNFIDGTAIGDSDADGYLDEFGELKNGVWIPKAYTGSYGTNGFRLQFDQTGTGTASASTIGADTSGNTHHFTSSGIVASDCNMPDSPENNFCTLSPLYYLTASTHLSEGNLQLTHESTAHRANTGTMFSKTGKWYFEVRNKTDTAGSTVAIGVGLQDISKNLVYSSGADNYIFYSNNNSGRTALNTTAVTWSTNGTHAPDAGDIIQVAYDADSGKIFFGIDNTYYAADAGADGNPATGDNPSATLSTAIDYIPFVGTYNNEATANFGQDSSFAGAVTAQGNTDGNGIGDFYYEPPSGYLALCSANLPEPTIGGISSTLPTDYFNTVLYSGNGGTKSVTGLGFKPDLFWGKRRDASGGHALYDTTRGATKELASHSTGAEITESNGLTSFDSDGFTLGSDGRLNTSSSTNVAWNWKANGGTTSSNTDGSITSTVQANTDAGFSIVTYTGNGTNGATIGHGLGVKPAMISFKNRDSTAGWATYHKELGATKLIYLDLTNASTSSDAHLNNTEPTDTLITLHDHVLTNSSDDYVAYCFAEIESYSRFGSYTGNGSADGAFVYTGFRPAWVMVKRTDSTNNWMLSDSVRDIDNVVTNLLYANLSNAEYALAHLDFTSNGFKLRTSNASWNASSGTYIYMAFAEAPFKYANGR